MAQLKDTVVSGSLRATDSLLTTTLQTKILNAPAASNGTSYGPGSDGQILFSNSTSIYWGSTTGITSVGTITTGTWSSSITGFTSGELLIGNGTSAVSTRGILNNTSVGALGWVSGNTTASNLKVLNVNTLAYWDGRYQTTNNSSNLAYCVKGAFGNAVTYGVDDATANGALGTGTGLTTERSVYYGLVTVNGASQTRGTGIYAPTSVGTSGQILISSGSGAPSWQNMPSTLPTGGTNGQTLVKASATNGDCSWGNAGVLTPTTNQQYYVAGSSSTIKNSDSALFNTSIYVTSASVLMGAAWNDYAEYCKCKEDVEPGRCIIENGDGSLSLSTKRLQGGAEIVSDTFGFAIGKTDECNVPIAVSGRVLAYINEDLKDIEIGAPVCSGPNGTVSQMSQDEAREYPWLIIGTISSIPQEEEWGQNKVKVNNRIWIRVR